MPVRSKTSLDVRLCEHALDYLRDDLPLEALAWQLKEAGYPLDADLLLLARSGPGPYVVNDARFRGRKVYVSSRPPPRATFGDVWYDLRELTATLLVPRLKVFSGRVTRETGEPAGWIGLSPLRYWQVLVFEKLARITWSRLLEGAARFRNRRWAPLEDQRFAAGLIHAEARAYAAWSSKTLQSAWDQNALYLKLPVELNDLVVGRGRGLWEEWTGDLFDRGQVGVVGQDGYLGILPTSIVDPETFSMRRLVRTFLSWRQARVVRAGTETCVAEKDFVIRGVLSR